MDRIVPFCVCLLLCVVNTDCNKSTPGGSDAEKEVIVDIDLKKEADELYAYILSRASTYAPNDKQGPGKNGPIKMAYAGFEFDQSGWFVLVFDRRAEAAHDGEWTSYIVKDIMLERKGWLIARYRSENRSIKVRGEDGKITDLPVGSSFGPFLGRMIVGVLERAERDGAFAKLPLGEGFRLGLEEFNGSFGWDSKTGFGGAPN